MTISMTRFASVGLLAITAVLVISSTASAENWSQWRGAKLDGISHETGLPVTWSPTKNVLWRVDMPGTGGATPVIWEDRIFVTSADGDRLVLICLSTSGKELWRRNIGSGNRKVRGDEGNSASPSPSTDGHHVWTFMGTGDLACFDFDGKLTWGFNVQERYGKLNIAFGMTSTPVLDGDRLYLQLIHGDGNPATHEARVVALEKNTGKEVWSRIRESDGIDECEHSYASPVIYRDQERAFLLSHGADYIVAHDLETGEEIWRCGNLNPKGRYNRTLRFVASPLAVPGLIVVPSAKNGPVLGLRPGFQGDITDNRAAHYWTRPRNTPDVPSPLVKDGLLYLCRENGVLICMDAKTGEQWYEQRLHTARHRASPVYADGRLYLTARDGVINVVKAGRTFRRLATNKMGEEMSASPAISGGHIYLRTFESLYTIGSAGK